VPAPLTAALAAAGIDTPFPIQAAVVPDALAGADILGRGQTGSGKTLGFCIPLVARLADGHTSAGRPRGLVLVPTRELASQVQDVLRPLTKAVGLRVATVFGGTSQRPQVTALHNRVDIIVACPGRLADLIDQGHCHLGDVEVSVVDEADHMADLGFLPAVRRLLDATPPGASGCCSPRPSTTPSMSLSAGSSSHPAEHAVDPPGLRPRSSTTCSPWPRPTGRQLPPPSPGAVTDSLIFTRTKHGARKLAAS
jgi:Superfamily II DNA and RNA helicases